MALIGLGILNRKDRKKYFLRGLRGSIFNVVTNSVKSGGRSNG
jgi:hypothetical protein